MGNKIHTQLFDYKTLKQAAEIIKKGGIVAFPTETVFGLGAIANNDHAVKNIFSVKGRPSDNPLIVHIGDESQVKQYVAEVNDTAQLLMDHFWPGPLTIIFPAKDGIFAPSISAGGQTVSLRMPAQLETLLLIQMIGFPIVGPSANLSGKPSPTRVNHVLHDLDGKIDGVLQSSRMQTQIGIESTVVIAKENEIVILRPGAITTTMLEKFGIPVKELSSEEQLANDHLQSPGVKYNHYSPKQKVYLISDHYMPEDWKIFMNEKELKIGVLANDEILNAVANEKHLHSSYSLGRQGDITKHASELYAGLRELELSNCDVIFVQGLSDTPQAHAYMNRLNRAADYII